jgi:hypothetical protein
MAVSLVHNRKSMPRAALLALSVLLARFARAAAPPEVPFRVPFEDVKGAIAHSRGYDILATTNGGRLQAEALIHLARSAQEARPDGPPLLVGHDEWFQALLQVAGAPAERAPTYARLAWQYKQDALVEYRPSRVIRQVIQGPSPRMALDVTISWPAAAGAPSEYSYEDTLSTPHVKVTYKRVITYHLLDYGDMIVFDRMEGLHGRPTSGALGLLFSVLGEGHIVEYRMALAPDGSQVSRGRARKAFFEVATTLTVHPDGRTEKGVPADPRLRAVEARLSAPIEIRYVN